MHKRRRPLDSRLTAFVSLNRSSDYLLIESVAVVSF